jgi:DNA-binding transcriptional MocR family regulator
MSAPAYLRIVQSIEADIRAGRLRPGDPVPSHRAAARRWKVAVATVTRAYAEAARRGLLNCRAGAVTRVAAAMTAPASAPIAPNNLADNIPLAPTTLNEDALLLQAFEALAHGRARALLGRAEQASDLPTHKAALGAWLASLGVPVAGGRTVLPSPGAQAALLAALRCVAMHAAVACEPLVNPGLCAAAQFLGVRLLPLDCDAEGPLPDALTDAARRGATALYASPTCSNPLALHWSTPRRRELGALVCKSGLWVIEDDDLLPLDPEPRPLAQFAPDRSISIVGSSKLAGFALRTAAVAVPAALADEFTAQLRAAVWMASPLLVEVLAQWQVQGNLGALALARRSEARACQQRALAALGNHGYRGPATGLHGWLPLTRPWDGERFAFHAARRGVAVTPAAAFRLPGATRKGIDGARLTWSAGADAGASLAALVGLLERGPRQ